MSAIFTTPVLVGLLIGLAVLPILIHLINMLRHRRVKWAAMEFLLQSYKKNRNWVWLKQLILLLMRMAVLILLLLMLAQVGCQNDQLAELLGEKKTHHYVLLDDSYSMSDKAGDVTAFDRARDTVQLIAKRAGAQKDQLFTLIRFSRAAASGSSGEGQRQTENVADLSAAQVDQKFDEVLLKKRDTFELTELSVGPGPALEIVKQLVGRRDDEQPLVYVVSDFRNKEWGNPTEIKQSLDSLKSSGAQTQLINCVKTERSNLGIINIRPENETRAAGVHLFVNVTVKNFGTETVRKVPVQFRSLRFDPEDEMSLEPENVQPVIDDDIPTELIDEIKPGDPVTRRVQVYFPKSGKHVVEARLPDDAVAADNTRRCVIEFLEGVPVLIIDDSQTGRNAYYLSSAFAPGRENTGIRPDVQTMEFLRDANPDVLNRYHAIYLLNIAKPDPRAVANLERYVTAGGGVGIFVGPEVDAEYYNTQLYRGGAGLLPLELSTDGFATLPEEIGEDLPDVLSSEHPVFATFLVERNPFVKDVIVEKYLRPAKQWSANRDPGVQVVARLRGGDPVAVEGRFPRGGGGSDDSDDAQPSSSPGRVVVMLTSIAPDWNNWARNPTFIIVALKLQSYLSAGQRADVQHVTGEPLERQLDAKKFRTDVTFVLPGSDTPPRPTEERKAEQTGDSPFAVAAIGQPGQTLGNETSRSGVYEGWAFTNDNNSDVLRWAVNVENSEGDLARANREEVLTRLASAEPTMILWEDFNPNPSKQAGFSWSRLLMVILICVLVGEQIVAYLVSYHPARGGAL